MSLVQKTEAVRLSMVTHDIGRITLNQAGRRNALTAQMWEDLTQCLEEAALDPDLRVLIITGAGEHFAAGADISEFPTLYATPESAAEISKKISTALNTLAQFPHPTIAKIRGACVGGGAAIALSCDLRFADGTANFAITPGKLGLVYPFSDVRRLVQTVGIAPAKDLLFSARNVGAEEAKQMGLINRLVEPYSLDQEVTDYALSICATAKSSVDVTKTMFLALQEGQRGETASTKQWFLDAFSSDDFKEGYSAFIQKRKPKF